jgi:hypothetical protein
MWPRYRAHGGRKARRRRAELMSYKTVQMTMRYVHLSPEFLAETVRKLDRPAKSTSKGSRKTAGSKADL